jgi:peptide-methionine (S)-S-oxide reductase
MTSISTSHQTDTAVFGGGCFWCTEALFQRLNGVTRVVPGYAGGHLPHPNYEEVCAGGTGHAEVVQIEFDPEVITYQQLLDVFMHTHEPTSLNRQGNDVGTQYRSIILTTSPEQRDQAEQYIKDLIASGEYTQPIVTEIKPLEIFYKAENYHLNYFNKNGYQPYCSIIIAPKVQKFLKQYSKLASGTDQ